MSRPLNASISLFFSLSSSAPFCDFSFYHCTSLSFYDYSDNINIDLVTKERPTLPVLKVLFRIQHSLALLRIIMQTAFDDNVKSTLRVFHGGLNCDIQTAGVVNSQEPYQLRKYKYGVKSKETVGNSWTV